MTALSSDQIYDALQKIAGTPSKNEKVALIKQYGVYKEFKRVLVASLSFRVTYGVAQIPEFASAAGELRSFDDSTWKLLDGLAERRLTGNAAREALAQELGELTVKSRKLLTRIITKDPKAGFSESSVNKAIPGCVEEFNVMLAESFKDYKAKMKYPAFADPKLDGFRAICIVDAPKKLVTFLQRSGLEYPTVDHLKPTVLELVNTFVEKLRKGEPQHNLIADNYMECVLEGELIAGSFQKTSGDLRRKGEQAADAVFAVFDLIPAVEFFQPGKDGVGGPYAKRRAFLQSMVPSSGLIRLVPSFTVNSEAEVDALFARMLDKKLEGLVVKDPKGLYHRRRNKAWLKVKTEETEDCRVKDWFSGEPGTKYEKMIGGYIVDFKGVDVRVGGGFSDEERAEDPTKNIGRLMEVEYHEVTPDGSLRHPRKKAWRDDKARREAA